MKKKSTEPTEPTLTDPSEVLPSSAVGRASTELDLASKELERAHNEHEALAAKLNELSAERDACTEYAAFAAASIPVAEAQFNLNRSARCVEACRNRVSTAEGVLHAVEYQRAVGERDQKLEELRLAADELGRLVSRFRAQFDVVASVAQDWEGLRNDVHHIAKQFGENVPLDRVGDEQVRIRNPLRFALMVAQRHLIDRQVDAEDSPELYRGWLLRLNPVQVLDRSCEAVELPGGLVHGVSGAYPLDAQASDLLTKGPGWYAARIYELHEEDAERQAAHRSRRAEEDARGHEEANRRYAR